MGAPSDHGSLALVDILLRQCNEGSFSWHQGVFLDEALGLLLCVAPSALCSVARGRALHGVFPTIYHPFPCLKRVLEDIPLPGE